MWAMASEKKTLCISMTGDEAVANYDGNTGIMASKQHLILTVLCI